MLAFHPFDTNNRAQQNRLGLSPPSKKCNKSPGKVPLDADMLFRSDDPTSDFTFQFDLKSIANTSTGQQASSEKATVTASTTSSSEGSKRDWQRELISKIDTFEREFAQRKATLLKSMVGLPDQE